VATPHGEALPAWEAGGIRFEVKPRGSLRGSYLLESPDMAISVNPTPLKGMPTVVAEIRAQRLWSTDGYNGAAATAEEVFAQLTDADDSADEHTGEVPTSQVSRVDITCDFQGWVPIEADLLRFACRARRDTCYRECKQLTGWSWGGGGAVLARLYDKRKEIKGTDKADWFPKLWQATPGYLDAEPVWRLEYQVKREALRELCAGNEQLKSWSRLTEHLGSLWQQLAGNWLVMRGQRTTKVRRTVDPLWAQLVKTPVWKNCTTDVDVARVKAEAEFNRTLDQLSAYLARGAAERWALDGKTKLWRVTMDELLTEAENRARKKSKPLLGRANDLYEPLKLAAELKAERNAEREGLRADERERLAYEAHRPYERQPGEEG
jgi:hypothetical protein